MVCFETNKRIVWFKLVGHAPAFQRNLLRAGAGVFFSAWEEAR